jgi:hypothetical protein
MPAGFTRVPLFLPWPRLHQPAATAFHFQLFLDHELVAHQVGGITLDALQPLFHHDHGNTGARDTVLGRDFTRREFLILAQGAAKLVKLVNSLAGGSPFLRDVLGDAARSGRLVCRIAGFLLFPVLIASVSLAGFLCLGSLISIIYRKITIFFIILPV